MWQTTDSRAIFTCKDLVLQRHHDMHFTEGAVQLVHTQ